MVVISSLDLGRCAELTDEVVNIGLQSDIHSMFIQTKHLMERLNTAQVKVKKLQRLEAALVDFFMEVMDRSDNNDRATRSLETESTFARGKRKEQFLKKAEGDPISLLNALRTHLRLKFAEQEAHETAAERRSLAESLNNQQKEQDIRDKFQQLERTCTQFKEQQQSLLRQLNRHEVDQTRTRRQHQTLLEKMNVQLQEVRSREQEAQQLVAKQQQEIAALKEARDALIKVTQTQKPLEGVRATADSGSNSAATPSATTAAASASGASPSHTNGDFFGTPAENQTLRRALRKYELKMAQTEADNEERKREVQRLQQQLTGLRQSTQLQMYSQLEKESRHLRELAADLKKRLAESEADLLRTKGTLKERESHMQKMRDEYARLFNAVQKQKQPTHYSPSKLGRSASTMQLAATSQADHSPSRVSGGTATDVHSESIPPTANSEHPYVVEHNRSEAARVERESEALKLQIRRMMASEQLHKQKTRVLRAEKQSLIRDRDQLRADLDRAKRHSTLQSIAMNRQQAQSTAETRKIGFASVPQDVKQLQKRNAFLEERFRKSLQSNSTLTTIGAVARLRNSISVPPALDGIDPATIPDNEADSESAMAGHHDPRIRRHRSMFITKNRPASASATTKKSNGSSLRLIIKEDNASSFQSLDTATLQSLQQVKRAT
ncbi:hypothetical protein PR003_g2250 [Phytophthora rubi]|uniref:Uncharacterized protein n=1 Tax=Phytophthora rubi TaxID=129364 RepID=A0A6A4G7S8_9STRA|nr:hypothetical protein PR003_g2250 [Phytophthora rubi]